jgi:hypothetical protein
MEGFYNDGIIADCKKCSNKCLTCYLFPENCLSC